MRLANNPFAEIASDAGRNYLSLCTPRLAWGWTSRVSPKPPFARLKPA